MLPTHPFNQYSKKKKKRKTRQNILPTFSETKWFFRYFWKLVSRQSASTVVSTKRKSASDNGDISPTAIKTDTHARLCTRYWIVNTYFRSGEYARIYTCVSIRVEYSYDPWVFYLAPVDRVKIPSRDPRLKSRIEGYDWSILDWIGGHCRALGPPSKGLNFCHNYRPPNTTSLIPPPFSLVCTSLYTYEAPFQIRHGLSAAAAYPVSSGINLWAWIWKPTAESLRLRRIYEIPQKKLPIPSGNWIFSNLGG